MGIGGAGGQWRKKMVKIDLFCGGK